MLKAVNYFYVKLLANKTGCLQLIAVFEYKLLSLTYKFLLSLNLAIFTKFSLQPPRSTHSSSVVTLSRLPTISSLKITDRSFRYASPRVWNQLPDSFSQPHPPYLNSPPHPLVTPFVIICTSFRLRF